MPIYFSAQSSHLLSSTNESDTAHHDTGSRRSQGQCSLGRQWQPGCSRSDVCIQLWQHVVRHYPLVHSWRGICRHDRVKLGHDTDTCVFENRTQPGCCIHHQVHLYHRHWCHCHHFHEQDCKLVGQLEVSPNHLLFSILFSILSSLFSIAASRPASTNIARVDASVLKKNITDKLSYPRETANYPD
jgi:hypothetical protein